MEIMKSLIFILLLGITNICIAEITPDNDAAAKGIISGVVIDKQSQKPIEYANIVLYNKSDSAMVTGTITSPEGKFNLKNIKEGNYYLVVQFIGYKKKIISDLKLSKTNHELVLEPIYIEQSSTQLAEVSVSTEKREVEYKIDKKVVNVAQNLNNTGGTAVDALKNVPGVNVDNDGNVSLRGSSSFTVLVDGKPTVMESSEALKQIPASSVEKMEVITNPSAKYDAEGTSGIINIIMKKGSNVGLNGVINASAGYKDKYTGDFLLNFKRSKINYFCGFNYRNTTNVSYTDTYKESTARTDTTDYLESNMIQQRIYRSYIAKAGFDYNINENNTLSFSGQLGQVDFDGNTETKYHVWESPVFLQNYTVIKERMKVLGNYFLTNLSYQKKFKKPGHELNSLIYYSYWGGVRNEFNDDHITTDSWDIQSTNPNQSRRLRDEIRPEMRMKIDYTLPIDSISKFEAGYQTSIKPITTDQKYEAYNSNSNLWVEDISHKDNLLFRNNIHALYSTFTSTLKKFEYQIGLRAEYNDRLLDQKILNKKFKYQKLDFFPSASISKQFKNNKQLQLSYSRRINRPNEQLLNPLPMYSDKYTSMIGNPELLPELINSFELNFLKRYTTSYFSIESYFRQHNNSFNQMIHVGENGNFYIDYGNIDKTYFFGADISGNIDIFKWLSISPAVSAFGYKYISNNITYDVPEWPVTMNARANINFKINKSTRIQINGFVNAPYYDVQGWQNWFYAGGVSARKDFLKYFTAVINVTNPFNIYQYRSENKATDLYNTFHIWNESPSIVFSLSYKINNYKPVQRREEPIDLNIN